MPSLVELRDQVQRILTSEFNNVSVDSDGDFSLRHESARVFIRCREQKLSEDRSRTLLTVWAIVLGEVPPSPELFHYVAVEGSNYIFGHLVCLEHESSVWIHMTHQLLGDYLDSEELVSAVLGIAFSANDLDDELQSRFGGRRFHED